MESREGYDDSRFVITVDKNLQCPICMNVLKEPVQCIRNQHYFCRLCITRHLEQNSQTCPVCQEELTIETLAQPPRLLTDLLSTLNIRCDYFERGCAELIELELLHHHVANCGYSPVLCGNDGCTKTMNQQDKEHHETELCDFRVLKCQDCGEDVPHKKKKIHGCELKKEVDKVKIDLQEIKDELCMVKSQIHCNQEEVIKELREIKNISTTQVAEFKEGMTHMQKEVQGLHHHQNRRDIFVAGGFDGKSQMKSEKFSWVERAWVPIQTMKERRFGASSFVYQHQMFVAGGGNSRHNLDTVERIQLNQKPEEWLDFPSKLPFKARGHSSVVYKDRLIFIGGYNDDEGSDSCSDGIYEILLIPPYSTKLLCTMPQPRCYHGSECIDDKIVIAGGATTRSVKDSLASVLLYDITNNNLKEMPPLPFPMCRMASVHWEGNVILFGGADNKGRILNSVVKYDVKAEEREMLPYMKHNRSGCAAVVTRNDVVVLGGYNHEEYMNNVEYFNLDSHVWEDFPPMKGIRGFLTAAAKT